MTAGVIVFASCMDAERCPTQPVWAHIQQRKDKPDLLLLLGDQIYMDWGLASLSKVPRFKKGFDGLSDADKAERLQLFAEEMHMRYRLQWAVPEFRALVKDIAMGGGSVRLAWDEHDFAWNNAYGEVATDGAADDRTVPQPFKAIALCLRRQFEAVLSAPGRHADYPALPDNVNTELPPPGLTVTRVGAVPVVILEQRWYRTHRETSARTLLGEQQLTSLLSQVQDGAGLLVLAGSSPLRHPYLRSNQGWWAAGEQAYPEFDQLMSAAGKHQRPILYLGGDIHTNAYGGRIEGSSVVQVLSSGAALGSLLIKRFRPSYGVVHLSDTGNPSQCHVGVSLVALGGPANEIDLQVADGRWSGTVPDGKDVDLQGMRYLGDLADLALLTVVCSRGRQKDRRKDSTLSPAIDELDDQAFGDEPIGDAYDRPEVMTVQGLDDGCLSISRQIPGLPGQDDQWTACWTAYWQQAFDRAASHGRNVLFFIHGFNKTFSAALDQAYALRALYPQCEPVLYTWAAGEPGGLLKSGSEYVQALDCAASPHESARLRVALDQFVAFAKSYAGQVRPPVILARSMGALALAHAMPGADGRVPEALRQRVIRRLVLSAPALTADEPTHWQKAICHGPQSEVVVTVNQNDRILRAQRWAGGGRALGLRWPEEQSVTGMHFIDFTQWQAVQDSHDYLLQSCGTEVDRLNAQLLSGADVDWTSLGARHRG